MSDIISQKISEFDPATSLAGDELVEVVQGGVNRRTTVSVLGTVSTDLLRTDLAADSGAELVGFLQDGTGAVARPTDDKLKDSLSVKDFGPVGDGVADDREALRAVLVEAGILGGAEVILHGGRYRVSAAADSEITVPSNTTIRGTGGAVIFFDDDPAVAVGAGQTNKVFTFDGAENITFENIVFEGTLLTHDSTTESKQLMGGTNSSNISLLNCTFRNLRNMATSFANITNAVVTGCKLENIGRDGIRFTHSRNIVVDNNVLKNVSDDCVALHSSDEGYPGSAASTGFVISNNVIEGSQGIRALGAKGISITGNTFRRCHRHMIHVESGWSASEGNTPQFGITITGNTIHDPLRIDPTGTTPTGVITVFASARNDGGLADQPGVHSSPFDYLYLRNNDTGSVVVPGDFGIIINNNEILRSLPNVAAYSDWGFGEYFDHRNVGSFWADPAITDADFGFHALSLQGPLDAVSIMGNNVSGLSEDLNFLHLEVDGTANFYDFNDIIISGNIVRDCPGHAIDAAYSGGTSAGAINLIVMNNLFDLDPYFRHTTHVSDNTWSATSGLRGIEATAGIGLVATGNTFKNLAQPVNVGSTTQYHGNYLWSEPVAEGNNAANLGIRVVDPAQICIVYDADPASATYGAVMTVPLAYSNGLPASGLYVKGHQVRKPNPVVQGAGGSQYTVIGWMRLTTGSGHVLNTDWLEMRTLTGT